MSIMPNEVSRLLWSASHRSAPAAAVERHAGAPLTGLADPLAEVPMRRGVLVPDMGPTWHDLGPITMADFVDESDEALDRELWDDVSDDVDGDLFEEAVDAWHQAQHHARELEIRAEGAEVGPRHGEGFDLRDPRTGSRLQDPVIAPDGLVYDRGDVSSLLAHLRQAGHDVSESDLRADQTTRDRLSGASTDDEMLEDPILLADMEEPLVASDGRTYDRATLERLFAEHEGRSPFTREPLEPVAYRHYGLEHRLRLQRGDAELPQSRRQPRVRFHGAMSDVD